MANFSTFSTIHARVNKYKEDYDLPNLSSAFARFALETILGINDDDVEDSITDGYSDGGIDAIYIMGDVVHIFNFKYAETFEKSKKNFPGSEIDQLLVTMDKIYNKNLKKKEVNTAIWEKVNEIWDLFKNGIVNFKYYLCSNKNIPVIDAQRRFEDYLNRFQYVEYCYLDQDDLVLKIMERKYNKVNGEIHFVDKNYFQRSDGDLKGIVATVTADDIINLVKDPKDPCKILEDAFNENIRVYLKLKNRINRQIFESATSEERYKFWYLNNGINIVCERCSYNPNTRTPLVKLENFQIVNGGQTTHTLFEAFLIDPEDLKDVLILVKICETKPKSGISEMISESTNSQNPIHSRDLHANDRIQLRLEEQFQLLGYYYERKKNQHQGQSKKFRVDNELLGQIFMAYYLDMPSEAKNKKVLVFGDKYDDIFNENKTTAEQMLMPYKVYIPLEEMKRNIQAKKRKKEIINEKDAFISRATFHLLNTVKYIAEKERLELNNTKTINIAIKRAIKIISRVVEKESKKRGDQYTHDKFFKEIPTNGIIKEHILREYSK
jgi:hypothetical protein